MPCRMERGANVRRNQEGVNMDRNITKMLKGKVVDSCVVPARTPGLEMTALSEQQQHRLNICKEKLHYDNFMDLRLLCTTCMHMILLSLE